MKAKVYDWYTDIFPTNDDIDKLCKPGQGANTCIWLLVAPTGFECCSKHRPKALLDRLEAGNTVAKRDGCDKVNNWNPDKKGEVEF